MRSAAAARAKKDWVSHTLVLGNCPPYGSCRAAYGRTRAARKISRVRSETRGLASRCVRPCARRAGAQGGVRAPIAFGARSGRKNIKEKKRTHERRALGALGSARGAGSPHGRDRACATCAVGRPSHGARPAPPPAASVGSGARGVTKSDRRKNEERKSAAARETREEGARGFGLRPRRGLPLRTAGSRGRQMRRGPSLARSTPHAAPCRQSGERRARAQREEAADGGGGQKSKARGRASSESARTARSPRAPLASHSDARARGPSRASPRTRRHADARRRGGSLHRAERKEGQTASERTMIHTTHR